MPTLDQVRAKLLEKSTKNTQETKTQNTGDNASYPFWNIPYDKTATLRFLPDADEDNVFFWRKREVIKLPFEGIVGGEYPTNKRVTVTVPCIDMFDMSCPITAHIRPWWKDEDKKELARTYYKKKSYIFQGFVVSSPIDEGENTPENPIRRFVINPSIFEIIEKSLHDPEIEDMPTDYVNGLDFRLSKTQKGEYANYQTSTWSRKTRSLDEAELAAIDQHGLFNLKEYLGRVPDRQEIDVITAMFHDSLDGKPFDTESYGKYYRAYTNRDDNSDEVSSVRSTPARASAPAPAAPETPSVSQPSTVAETSTPSLSASPQDILERIKNRRAAQ